MADPLNGAKYVLARASKHAADFKAKLVAFNDSNPFIKGAEVDTNTGERVLKLKLGKEFPDDLLGLAFDTICNLRSALDQAGYAASVAIGGKGKETYFPFGDTIAEVKSRRAGGSKEIPPEIFAVMEGFKPYQGGDDLLWSLNKLANTNKHRILVPVAIKAGEIQHMDASATTDGPVRIAMNPEWDSDKNEMELGRIGGKGKFKYNVEITMSVAFGEIGVISGAPADAVLDALCNKVEGVLMAVEAEGKRIGIFP